MLEHEAKLIEDAVKAAAQDSVYELSDTVTYEMATAGNMRKPKSRKRIQLFVLTCITMY